jgi:hypothetical protein
MPTKEFRKFLRERQTEPQTRRPVEVRLITLKEVAALLRVAASTAFHLRYPAIKSGGNGATTRKTCGVTFETTDTSGPSLHRMAVADRRT